VSNRNIYLLILFNFSGVSTVDALIPGQSMIISQPIQLRFNELLEGVRADVSLKIYGEDMDIISDAASKAAAILKTIDGVGDAEEEVKGKSPVLKIEPRASALNNLGLPKENVLSTVETAIGGSEAGSFYEGIMRFPIIVRLDEKDRKSIRLLGKVPVGIAESYTRPLSEVADIRVEETYSDIRRESSKKRAAVLVNVRGRDTESLVKEAKAKIDKEVKLPAGYYMEWGGSFKNLEQARERLMIVVPVALALVLMMIYMAFQSVIQTAMIAACIHKLDGLSGDELIKHGTKLRLRPVIMTAAGAAFGFLPMMLSTGMGAEVQRPLASVVVGGIISATLLTLIVLPVVYRLLEDKMVVKESSISH